MVAHKVMKSGMEHLPPNKLYEPHACLLILKYRGTMIQDIVSHYCIFTNIYLSSPQKLQAMLALLHIYI